MSMLRFLLAASLLIGGLGLAGCQRGPRYVPVSGVVTIGGQPLAGAAVSFQPLVPGEPSIGVTDDQGRFSLKTAHDQEGAVVGEHQIAVYCAEGAPLAPGESKPPGDIAPAGFKMVWKAPQRYMKFETSQLETDVQPGMAPVELKLEP